MSATSPQDEINIAKQYLADNKINKLFKRLLVLLLLHQPADVKKFIVDQLRNEKALQSKPLLSDEEIATTFKMIHNPLLNKECISGKKINGTLVAMGITESVNNDEMFNFDQFKQTMNNILKNY